MSLNHQARGSSRPPSPTRRSPPRGHRGKRHETLWPTPREDVHPLRPRGRLEQPGRARAARSSHSRRAQAVGSGCAACSGRRRERALPGRRAIASASGSLPEHHKRVAPCECAPPPDRRHHPPLRRGLVRDPVARPGTRAILVGAESPANFAIAWLTRAMEERRQSPLTRSALLASAEEEPGAQDGLLRPRAGPAHRRERERPAL
jgi:hypothetical protein